MYAVQLTINFTAFAVVVHFIQNTLKHVTFHVTSTRIFEVTFDKVYWIASSV
jgi:hypothetical protein